MDVSQIINSAPLTTNLCRIQSDTINMTTYRCFIYSHIAPVSWLSTRLVRVVNELWYDASTEKESFKKSLFLLKQLSLAHARIDVCLSPNTFLAFIHIINQLTLAFLNTHKNEAYYRLVAMGISDYCSTPTPYQRQRAKEIRDLIGNPETSQTIPTLQPFTLFSHAETDDQASKLAWYHKKSFFI